MPSGLLLHFSSLAVVLGTLSLCLVPKTDRLISEIRQLRPLSVRIMSADARESAGGLGDRAPVDSCSEQAVWEVQPC